MVETEASIPDNDQEPIGLVGEYWGIRVRTLKVLVALVACVFVVVTGIYIALFGFRTWSKNMRRAGSMMVINFEPPATAPPATAPPPALQYTCPTCGPVGLPQMGPNGASVCPQCGAPMTTR